MEVSQDNKKLGDLIDQAKSGLLKIPEFQRNFVWKWRGVESLLESLLKGQYIGALLFLETDKEHMPFGYRKIAGLSSDEDGIPPEDLVLDGQQRITALHYAFAAPDIPLRDTKHPYRFFLELSQVDDLEDADDAVWCERFDRVQHLQSPETQFEQEILPFSRLPEWESWTQEYLDWLYDQEDPEALKEYIKGGKQRRWHEAVSRIRDARVPVVTLPKVKPDDYRRVREICDVFEKLNSTGIKLTVFDLLTARLHPDVNLHNLWQDSLENFALLRRFSGGEPDIEAAQPDDFGVLLLRTVALLRGQEVKSKKLIELDKVEFAEDWERASDAMEQALKRATSTAEGGFGAFGRRWLPYKTVLPVLAALITSFQEKNLGAGGYLAMRRWYWSSVFLNRYAGATETLMYQDFHELLGYVRGSDGEPTVFSEARSQILENPGFSLRGVSSQGAAAYKGAMNVIALEGARDFANNDGIIFHDLDDHHIFPRKYLEKKLKLIGGEVNTIVNRTLIVDSTNKKISSKSPSTYLESVIPEEHRVKILASHLIDTDAHRAMEEDDYEAFRAARERALISKIRELVS